MHEEPLKDEELIDEAIGVVSGKLANVHNSAHIVALSQELRALIEERKKLGINK